MEVGWPDFMLRVDYFFKIVFRWMLKHWLTITVFWSSFTDDKINFALSKNDFFYNAKKFAFEKILRVFLLSQFDKRKFLDDLLEIFILVTILKQKVLKGIKKSSLNKLK